MSGLEAIAPAKINLTLEVLGKRPDGYHAIRSVMQTITLADRLTVTPAPDLTLRCDRPDLETPDNLVWRAAMVLSEESGCTLGAAMRLHKQIPVAAGLGGGSADAAATLLALDRLWGLRTPPERLADMAAQIGSDVPFFLVATGCALIEGRGERVTPLPPLPPQWVVLVTPPVGISAGAVYRVFPPAAWQDGTRTAAWLAAAGHGQVPAPFNDLEAVAVQVAPACIVAREALLAAGAPYALMSGSGSTFFCLFQQEEAAQAVYSRLRTAGHQPVLAAFGPSATVRDV